MKFQTGVSKFQFKVSFSSSKFAIRASKLKSLHFILAQSGTSTEFRPLSLKLPLSSPE